MIHQKIRIEASTLIESGANKRTGGGRCHNHSALITQHSYLKIIHGHLLHPNPATVDADITDFKHNISKAKMSEAEK